MLFVPHIADSLEEKQREAICLPIGLICSGAAQRVCCIPPRFQISPLSPDNIASGLRLQTSEIDERTILECLGLGAWLNAIGLLLSFLGLYVTYKGDSFFGTPPDYRGTFLILTGFAALQLVVQWVLFYIVTGSPRILPWRK